MSHHSETPSSRQGLAERAKIVLRAMEQEFGTPFAICPVRGTGAAQAIGEEGRASCPSGPSDSRDDCPPASVRGDARGPIPATSTVEVAVALDGRWRIHIRIGDTAGRGWSAVGHLPILACRPEDVERERGRLRKWAETFLVRLYSSRPFAEDSHTAGAQGGNGERRMHTADLPAAAQAEVPYPVLFTIDQVVRRLRMHKDPVKNQQRILEAAHGVIEAAALAWIPHDADQPVVQHGQACLTPAEGRRLAGVLVQLPEALAGGPAFFNAVRELPWGGFFPQVENLLVLPIADQKLIGWVAAINRQPAQAGSLCYGFRKSDAALLLPFASLLEMHLRAAARYQDLKDFFIGLTRALTTVIDAREVYTYGHSERVARIAVQLGRELQLDSEALSDLYLAGLLHDIGNIGLHDSVVYKDGPLTPAEEEHVRQHVTIGYSILADLRQIRNVLPGVLYHHEHYDGTGYPDGLAGENIPLIARILAVADAYDALSSSRPHRDALPCRRIEEILQEGAGKQWDKRVVEAFMRCRQQIHILRQRGVGESLKQAMEGILQSRTTPARSGAAPPRPPLLTSGYSSKN